MDNATGFESLEAGKALFEFELCHGSELGRWLSWGGKRIELDDSAGKAVSVACCVYPGIEIYFNELERGPRAEESMTVPEVLEVNYCIEGRFECSFGSNSSCFMSPGDFAVCPMMKRKTSQSYPLGYYKGVTVLIDWSKISDGLCSLCLSFGVQMESIKEYFFSGNRCCVLRREDRVMRLFDAMGRAASEGKLAKLRLLALTLLSFLEDMTSGKGHVESGYHNQNQVRKVREIASFMTEHLREHHTITEPSERAGMSPTALKTAFSRVFGTSIYSYLRTYRLQRAQKLLRETSLPVAEIAFSVGYGNPGKFSSVFKSVYGCTPTAFRNSVRLEGS